VLHSLILQQLIACSLLTALLNEYASSSRSSDVGLPWELHCNCKTACEVTCDKPICSCPDLAILFRLRSCSKCCPSACKFWQSWKNSKSLRKSQLFSTECSPLSNKFSHGILSQSIVSSLVHASNLSMWQ
jgi:hypothetical protein